MPTPMPTPTPTEPPAVPVPTPPAPAPVPTPPPAPASGATPPPEPSPVAGPQRPGGVSDAEWAALGDPGKAALVRVRQEAAEAQRALAAEQAKVKAFEDANKTQEERDAEARAALERTSAENAAKALRYEIAAEKGIPLSAAPRLVGGTREELAADADKFLADFPALRVSVTRAPAPDPSQGPRPTDSPKSDADKTYEALYGAQTERK